MINNFPMFHQNKFIICVLIPIFIYVGKKTIKIVSFSMQIIRNLKNAIIEWEGKQGRSNKS